MPRLPPRAELFAEVQFCRRHIVSRFRSRFFNRRSCILVDTSSVRFGSVQCRAIANQHGSTNRATTTGCHQSSIKRALIHFETKPWLCAGAALKRAFKASERRQLRRAVARGIYSPFGAQQPRWPPWASRRRRPSCISLRHMDVYVLVVSTRHIF